MGELLPVLGVLVLLGLPVAAAIERAPGKERPLLYASLLAHLALCAIRLELAARLYGGSDADSFEVWGERLARLVRSDAARWAPEVAMYTVGLPHRLPVAALGHSSTGAMVGLTVLGLFLTGHSLTALHVALTIAGFAGKWAMYGGLRTLTVPELRGRLLVACLLTPSVVFWTTGLVKETLAVVGLGLVTRGLGMVSSARARAAAHIALGAWVLALFKPFFLLPMAAGVAGFLVLRDRRWERLRLSVPRLAVALVLSVLAVVGIGVLFPALGPEHLADTVADFQARGRSAGGGSGYELGEPGPARGALAQLGLAPLALLTSLARPFPFEVRNLSMIPAAVETSVLAVLLTRAVLRLRTRGLQALVAASPVWVFVLVLVGIGAVGVGLATTNFGTLSRYRVPFFPLWAAFVLAADAAGAVVAARRGGTPGPSSFVRDEHGAPLRLP